MNTQSFWSFEVGTEEGVSVPVWIFVIFQQSDRTHDQNLNNDTFYRMPVTSAQCIVGTETYPDSSILLNYSDDECSQEYGPRKEVFNALTKDDTFQSYISEHDFGSSNIGNIVGYNSQVFDIRYRRNFESAQPMKLNFQKEFQLRFLVMHYN